MLARVREDASKLSAGSHRIHLEVDREVGLLGDYNELYSAFSNLAFNAVQYTPGGGEVRIGWDTDEAGGRLWIRDSGVGIEAHHVPRLTERFYRADKARSREVGGTGLGLAIVKHVLMRHEARLHIESELGVGSTFECRFPASRLARLERPALVAEA
jgi:two-component system, OmpR family, phosphate regulon sensor histidine kinase PhoR